MNQGKTQNAEHEILFSDKINLPGKTVYKKENNSIASFATFDVWQGLTEILKFVVKTPKNPWHQI